ncbi:MAG: hypothetical protein JWR84_3945 [Caulobacter sp.]|nr:hypothetical protein [Caulobacter sp.]
MRLIAVATIALSALLGGPAWAAESISKYEVRRAPAARVEREVLGQLADIIKPSGPEVRPLTDEKPVMPLTDMWFETEPRNTEAPGLCRFDVLVMEFEPTGEPGTGADTRVHASGFTASSQYAVIAPPQGVFDDVVYGEKPPPRGPSCKRIPKQVFFSAPDMETAFNGVYRLNQVFAGAASGSPAFALECVHEDAADKCRKRIVDLNALKPEDWGMVGGIERCDPPPGVYGECLEASLDSTSVRMLIVEGRLKTVTVNQMLILSHARRD